MSATTTSGTEARLESGRVAKAATRPAVSLLLQRALVPLVVAALYVVPSILIELRLEDRVVILAGALLVISSAAIILAIRAIDREDDGRVLPDWRAR